MPALGLGARLRRGDRLTCHAAAEAGEWLKSGTAPPPPGLFPLPAGCPLALEAARWPLR